MSTRFLVGGGLTPMTKAKNLDQRVDERDGRFTGEFSLKLLPIDQTGKVIPVRPMDVSLRGLGFLAREAIKIGSIHTLLIGERRFRVELAYCSSHLGIEGLFRCGLFLREADGNLQLACEESGLLQENNSYRSIYTKRQVS